jgi:nitroreductase family protein
MIEELIKNNRAYRRYYQNKKVSSSDLLRLVDIGRISSCGNNMQALKYIVCNTKDKNDSLFQNIRWAAALPDWDGPIEGERPSAYIVILLDTNIRKDPMWDHGIAATNILLLATELGYGGCMFASFEKKKLQELFDLGEDMVPLMVISLGVPLEKVQLEDMRSGNYQYYRDEEDTHHVPKRSLKEVLIGKYLD